jgi:putative acetyltransferase
MDLHDRATHHSAMDELQLRATTSADIDQVLSLYRSVAATPNSGLARHAEEIGREYVAPLPSYRNPGGISIVALLGDALVGEIHAARMQPRQFSHVLTDLTVVVHPQAQGRGVGSRLFAALFETAARLTPPVTRIELVARTGNAAAIRLYERLGFRAEGRFVGRVRLPDGRIEDDIPMARIAAPASASV